MGRELTTADGVIRTIAPTTTTRFAVRMLATSAVIAEHIPITLRSSVSLDILLALHVAEEDARYPTALELSPPGSMSTAVTKRWLGVLVQAGLVERRGDLLALSDEGHLKISALLAGAFEAQRALD